MFRLVIEIDNDFTKLVDEDGTIFCQIKTLGRDEDMYYYLIGHLCTHFVKLDKHRDEIEQFFRIIPEISDGG